MDAAYKTPQQQHLCIVVTADESGTVEKQRCSRWGRHLTTIGLCLVVLVVLPLHPILPVVEASSPDPSSRPNSSSTHQLPTVTASARQLDRLFSNEQLVVGHLRRFVSRTDRHLELIESYLDVYDTDRVSSGAASNPARDYKLLQRIEEFWNPELYNMDDLLTDLTSARDLMSQLGSRPVKDEAVETISALLRIQKIYHLDIVQLARGTMLGLETGTELSLTDVRKLADIAFSSRAIDLGLVWTEALQELIRVTGDTTHLTQVNRELIARRQQHDDLLRTSAGQYQLFPQSIGSRSARQLQQEISDSSSYLTRSDPTRSNPTQDGARYDLLCRGVELRASSILARLSCDFHVPDLYYTLQPIKRETLHRQPFIYSFHDFINDGQIEQLVQLAIVNMTRSGVGSHGSTAWSRVSTTARIPHSERIAARMDANIRMATGLETSDRPGYRQEMIQVAEYGTAGFFGLHYDFLNITATQSLADTDVDDKMMLDAGERTASFMIYLSDVQRGGRTVFPRLGLSILPERGSAVFWYNKLPDDTLDMGTLHAGCPVAYGHKWIANKFIRDTAQTFTNPCRY